MAILKNTSIDDINFFRLPSGTTAQRPVSPTVGMIRYNTTIGRTEVYKGTDWKVVKKEYDGPGSSESNPATSCRAILNSVGQLPNGFYWIKPTSGDTAYETYCDFYTAGGGWTCIQYQSFADRFSGDGSFSAWTNTQSTVPRTASRFRAPLEWRKNVVSFQGPTRSGGGRPEYLIYITNNSNLEFDHHSQNNFVTVVPQAQADDFLYSNFDGRSGIHCWGKIRGIQFGNGPYTGNFNVSWWNNGGSEAHIDTSGWPWSVSSEDNFGIYGSNNPNHFNTGQFSVAMAR